jgi:hypothetical protein
VSSESIFCLRAGKSLILSMSNKEALYESEKGVYL